MKQKNKQITFELILEEILWGQESNTLNSTPAPNKQITLKKLKGGEREWKKNMKNQNSN